MFSCCGLFLILILNKLILCVSTDWNMPSIQPDALPWNEIVDDLLDKTVSYELMTEPIKRPSFETYYSYFYSYSLGKPRAQLRHWLLEEMAPYLLAHKGVKETCQLELVADTLIFPLRATGISKEEFLHHCDVS